MNTNKSYYIFYITSVLINESLSFVEFVWDTANSMWKIDGFVCGGMVVFTENQIRFAPAVNSIQDTQTVDLTLSGHTLSADLRIGNDSALLVNNDGVVVNINPSLDNAIHLRDGGLYSGAVDSDWIRLIEKQIVFFNGIGSHISLGELDVGNWDDDEEFPLVWDCESIDFYVPETDEHKDDNIQSVIDFGVWEE